MEKKDKESPTSIQNEFTNHLEMLKLCKRKQDIQSAIMRKRIHDINPIAGYNLSSFRPKYKKNIKDVGIVEEKTTKAIPVTPS